MDNYRPIIGTPLSELETPCFVVDLDALESNFKVVADTYRDTTVKMREHTKNIKSPFLAKMQMDIGGTNGGVCTAKVAEAEVMVQGGVTDILIPNQIVAREKIERMCNLARYGDIKVCVSEPQNVRDISEVAAAKGVEIGVLIECDTSMQRAGVRTPQQGVEIAKLTQSLPGVAFRGVMSHQAVGDDKSREGRFLRGRQFIDMCLAVKHAVEAEGIPVEIVSSGETFTYDVAVDMPEVTEVEGGSYALMSTGYSYMTEFKIAGKMLGTIVSAPRPGFLIGDVGTRALAGPGGMIPTVDNLPGVSVDSIHEEHIVLKSDGTTPLSVGDKFLLLPAHQDMLVNRWDQYVCFRNGVVEDVWDIPGRGCYH